MGQYSGFASPEATNRRFRELIARGQTGFSIALDLPTQMGLDSDHPLAAGEVGKVGVPLNSLRDMEVLLDGIELEDVRQIRTSANAIGPIVTAMFVAAARKHGVDPRSFRVMLQNDSLKEYTARGTYIFPPEAGLRFSADVLEYCAAHIPNWEPIEFCGYHIRDSGATAAQEVAIAYANGLAYLEEVARRGVDLANVTHSMVVFLAADLEILEEVAKFRAARRVWGRLMQERFGLEDPENQRISIFCYTLGGSLSAREPRNNLIRVAYEALAAALGGVQTLATSSYDEALGLPSDEAVNLSLRTQQILAFETGVTSTTDPLGGSWMIESLTDDLEAEIRSEIAAIEDVGGAVAAIDNGYVSNLLTEAAHRVQLQIDNGERVVVGQNAFRSDAEDPTFRTFRVPEDAEATAIERLKQLRNERSDSEATRALLEVERVAKTGTNTVPAVLEAVEAYATIGEICDALRSVWGTHGDSTI